MDIGSSIFHRSTTTVTQDRASFPVALTLKGAKSSAASPDLSTEIEALWQKIFSSALFTFEESMKIEGWKREFLSKYLQDLSSDEGKNRAAIMLCALHENFFVPFKSTQLDLLQTQLFDAMISHWKLILAAVLPPNEEVEAYIARYEAFVDERNPKKVAFEAKTLAATLQIYDQQTEELYKLANKNRELIGRNFVPLKKKLEDLCEQKKSQDSELFKRVDAVKGKLNEDIKTFQQQEKVLAGQAEQLQSLRRDRLNLLSQVATVLEEEFK